MTTFPDLFVWGFTPYQQLFQLFIGDSSQIHYFQPVLNQSIILTLAGLS